MVREFPAKLTLRAAHDHLNVPGSLPLSMRSSLPLLDLLFIFEDLIRFCGEEREVVERFCALFLVFAPGTLGGIYLLRFHSLPIALLCHSHEISPYLMKQ